MPKMIMTNYGKKLLLAKISMFMDQEELESCMMRLDMSYEELNKLSGTTEVKYLRQDNDDDQL